MALQLEKVFLGNTPQDQRKFVTGLLEYLGPRYPSVVIPCVGQFTLAKCAIEAGYPPEQISASDISLFSSALGYLYSGRPLEELPFNVNGAHGERYARCASDVERAAFLLWLMKVAQLNEQVFYEREIMRDYVERQDHYIGTWPRPSSARADCTPASATRSGMSARSLPKSAQQRASCWSTRRPSPAATRRCSPSRVSLATRAASSSSTSARSTTSSTPPRPPSAPP